MTSVDWIESRPKIKALRDCQRLHDQGFEFLSQDVAKQGGESLRQHYSSNAHLGMLWTNTLWAECQRVAEGLWLLAIGPDIPTKTMMPLGLKNNVHLYINPDAPDTVWLSPGSEFPAALFTEVPADGETVADAVHSLFLDRPDSAKDLPRCVRAFMGYPNELQVPSPYSGQMEKAFPHELDRHFTSSPALDNTTWGGAFLNSPFPPDQAGGNPFANMLAMNVQARKARKQSPGSVARFTRHALFSRAHVAYEIHQARIDPIYVWDIQYRPNPFPQTIRRFNEVCGTHFPVDLPADVVAGIYGFDWWTAEQIEQELGDETTLIPHLKILAAVRYFDGSLKDLIIRKYLELDPESRKIIMLLCFEYNWLHLTDELALFEKNSPLLDMVFPLLGRGTPQQQFNDMGEPVELYDGSPAGGTQ